MSRPELLVLTGLVASGVEATISHVRALDPQVAVLHHDLRDVGSGRVHRRLRRGRSDVTTTIGLAHGCVSCTVREDVLPQLRALAADAGRIVLHLDAALEPEHLCWTLRNVPVDGVPLADEMDLLGVVTVVDACSWFDDATGDAVLPQQGPADLLDDERTVAQVAVGQAEFADLLVVTGRVDAWEHARLDAVLARLAPAATRRRLDQLDGRLFAPGTARRGLPDDVHAPLLRGTPPLEGDCAVRLALFSARRPFHPGRLHVALDALLTGVVRTRGRIWLATRPDAVLWLESAGGGLQVGHAGEWLAGAPADAWEAAAPERRALASLGWHPRFGDRAQDLAVLVHAADPAEIDARLREALLTDAELAEGENAWRDLPDPFGLRHTDPCRPVAGLRPGSTGGEGERPG